MVDLDFAVEGAEVEPHAAAPLLRFALRVTNRTPAISVENVDLRCQIRIEPARRPYAANEADRLSELFGARERWGDTLKSLLWTHAAVAVPRFASEIRVDLPVPCSYDFNIAATKYFHGLASGTVPLALLFSGSVFYRDEEDRLQIGQIAWSKEAGHRLPVAVWRAMMDRYYPGVVWLDLGDDVFERLYAFRRRHGFATWDRTLEALLADAAVKP
ncbi:MAG: hypothetical protein JO209_02155 [Acidisphaera sp.]|nr:hypothetical protein [Acidisphaera sp.]